MPWGTFKLGQLKLDQENIRIGPKPQPDQRATLKALAADQTQKLVNLALDLLDVGPSPGEPIWVTADPKERGQYIVLEGNRRVCALKMLDNPALAADTEVASAFAQMAKDFAAKPIRSLEAQVFTSREEARPFIERRHMSAASGVALQRWRSLRIARAAKGARVRRSLIVLDYLDDGTDEFAEVAAIIDAKSTSVDRVLNAPAMREVLGVDIDLKQRSVTFENGDEIAGRRLLRDLITGMSDPEFTFSRIRDSGDRDAFIGGFADQGTKGAGSSSTSGSSSSGGGGGAAAPAGKGKRKRLVEPERGTLAPKHGDRTFNVPGKRLNKLYAECRLMKLDGNENAAALLLRVFLELSSEAYLIEKSVALPAALAAKKGKTDWSEVGITLADKINAVMPIIDKTARTKQQLKKGRVALSTQHATGSVDTLHAYFHNLDMTPDIAGIRDAWDTWENYLRLLHAARV